MAIVTSFIYLILLCLPAKAEWQNQGHVKGFFSAPQKAPSANISGQNGGLEIETNATFKPNRSKRDLRLKLHPTLKWDALTTDEKFLFEPTEAYGQAQFVDLRVRAGFQTLAWPGTDFQNLLDMVHTKNWREPLNPQSRPAAGIGLYFEKSAWSLEGIYIPKQRENILPGEKSAWWPRRLRLPLEGNQFEVTIPENVEYSIGNTQEFNNATQHQLGLKFDYRHSDFETSVAAFEGASADPLVFADLDLTLVPGTSNQFILQSPVRLRPFSYRHRVIAGLFTLPLGSWIFRASERYQQSLGTDSRLPGWARSTVLAIEKNFSLQDRTWTTSLQYFETQQGRSTRLAFLRSIFERSIAVGLRAPLSDEMIWLNGFVYDLQGLSSYLRSNLAYSFAEHWSAQFEVNLFQGPENTLLGAYDSADRATIECTYHF